MSSRDLDVHIGFIYTHERQYMPPLVKSLAASGQGVAMRLILVDNNSVEGVGEWEGVFDRTVVIRNRRRMGYAANLNEILAATLAKYVLLLNTDMYFDAGEQFVAKMVRFMNDHPDCGVSGCRLYHQDGGFAYPARRFQTLKTLAARRLGLGGMLAETLSSYLYQDRSPDDVFDCDWLSGCLLMIRRQAFEEVGYLDSGFTKYFEDVDFCLRMARAGWRVMYNGGTYGYHYEQRDSQRLFSRDAARHVKSYLRWLTKWGFDPKRHVPAAPPRIRRAA